MLEAEHKLKLLIQDRPWETEPDHLEWKEATTKYKCEVKRNPMTLALCGYVTVPKKHHFYGLHYDKPSVSVHGGLTYADKGKFGFDCAHAGDLSPGVLLSILAASKDPARYMEATERFDTYRTFDWVVKETEKLARGLHRADAELEDMFFMEAAKNAIRRGAHASKLMAEEYERVKAAWLKSLED